MSPTFRSEHPVRSRFKSGRMYLALEDTDGDGRLIATAYCRPHDVPEEPCSMMDALCRTPSI
jgi:hypothetical protein